MSDNSEILTQKTIGFVHIYPEDTSENIILEIKIQANKSLFEEHLSGQRFEDVARCLRNTLNDTTQECDYQFTTSKVVKTFKELENEHRPTDEPETIEEAKQADEEDDGLCEETRAAEMALREKINRFRKARTPKTRDKIKLEIDIDEAELIDLRHAMLEITKRRNTRGSWVSIWHQEHRAPQDLTCQDPNGITTMHTSNIVLIETMLHQLINQW